MNTLFGWKPSLTRCRIACLLFLMSFLLGGQLSQVHAQGGSKARRWRVMVLVPEQHLAQPRIPDPAVETSIMRQLIDADYKLIDQGRIATIRDSGVADRIRRGGPAAAREVAMLRRQFGADILITGEAFTQEVARRTVETDMGPVLRIQCRARVELRGIRMDTAEIFYTDSIQQTGPAEPTVELSSKACLEQAAETMGPKLLQRLDKLAFNPSRHIELEVRGIASRAQAAQLEKVLQTLHGVQDVAPGDYDARIYSTEITLSETAFGSFAARLETDPKLKPFKLKVQSDTRSRIVVNSRSSIPVKKPGK